MIMWGAALWSLALSGALSSALADEDGYCNIRECGCPPYRQPWCDKWNSRVFSPICQYR